MPWTKLQVDQQEPDFDEHAGQDVRKLSFGEVLSEGRHYLVVSSDNHIQEKYGPFAYRLHVIHPVGTEFNCATPPSPDASVVLVKGFDSSSFGGSPTGQDCESYFQQLISDLGNWGIPRSKIATVSTYHNDSPGTCDVDIGLYPNDPDRHRKHYGEDWDPDSHTPDGGHTTNTSWRHVAYHLAWYVSTLSGPVAVVGHSGGGLIIRYAMMMSQRRDPAFPSSLDVRDAVTHGTSHDGVARWMSDVRRTIGSGDQQCRELKRTSDFIRTLRRRGRNPGVATGRSGPSLVATLAWTYWVFASN